MEPPFGADLAVAMFGMGCFWGAEKKFWQVPGVVSTQVGYAAGLTPNPSYREVCSGRTGHNEVVRVVFDPKQTSYETLLKVFWETTIRRKGCARATTSAPSTAPGSTSTIPRSTPPPTPRVPRISRC
jgi:hypothetical protein